VWETGEIKAVKNNKRTNGIGGDRKMIGQKNRGFPKRCKANLKIRKTACLRRIKEGDRNGPPRGC